jgi:uncharacterized membrane protein YkoI
MKINKFAWIALVLFGLLICGLTVGVALNQRPLPANAAPPAQQTEPCPDDGDLEHEAGDDIEDRDACGDNDAPEADNVDEAGETEAAVSPDQADITAAEAQAAAEAAYPGTKALEVELESENGVIAYEVELDNGLEILINPTNGNILGNDRD